jgi:C-terminal peptidase prc
MSRILALLGVVLCGCPLLAVSRSSSAKPAGPPLTQADAQGYALQLKTALDLIARQYARPVARADLAVAALKGLYRTAGATAPAALAAEIKKADNADNQLVDLITQARATLGNPIPLQGTRALEVSLLAALQSLDPYCFLTTSVSYLQESDSRKDGLGLTLAENTGGPFLIKTVIPGGPAQRAGILPEDQVIQVNGLSLAGKSTRESQGPYGWLTTPVNGRAIRLCLARAGTKKPIQIALEPRAYTAETVFGVDRRDDNSWNYLLDPKKGIAHIRLGPLKRGTAEDLQHVLQQLQKAGVRGVVLDLRWCPGGLLDESVEVASLLVGDRTIATIEYRDGRKTAVARRGSGSSERTFVDIPLVVLINGQTLGGGELIAAAIQDTKRAPIVGQRTVGKGSVQNALTGEQETLYHPVANLTVRLSIGVFTRLSGKNLQRFASSKDSDDWGVRPDAGLEYTVSRELSLKLGELWLLQTLRPGSSRKVLPLDDPSKDPQRQFALKVLLRMLNEQKRTK